MREQKPTLQTAWQVASKPHHRSSLTRTAMQACSINSAASGDGMAAALTPNSRHTICCPGHQPGSSAVTFLLLLPALLPPLPFGAALLATRAGCGGSGLISCRCIADRTMAWLFLEAKSTSVAFSAGQLPRTNNRECSALAKLRSRPRQCSIACSKLCSCGGAAAV